ncbi:MAG: hypothetical protein ACTSRZ_09220 [Promethearchaeota archaeon]
MNRKLAEKSNNKLNLQLKSRENHLKIISITHAEDLDGICSQSIIVRYFNTLQNSLSPPTTKNIEFLKELKEKLFSKNINNNVELVLLHTEYDGYLLYWAAIFAKNLHLFDIDKIASIFSKFVTNNNLESSQSSQIAKIIKLIQIHQINEIKKESKINFWDIWNGFINYFGIQLNLPIKDILESKFHINSIKKEQKIVSKENSNSNISNKDIEFRFFNRDLIKTILNIKQIAPMLEDPEYIIITDIGFNISYEVIIPLWSAFKCKIIYLDHHEIAESIKNRLSNILTYINIDNSKCSALITQNIFLPEDIVAKKLADYAIDSDFQHWKLEFSKEFQEIIGKYYSNREKLLFIIDLFAKGKLKDQSLRNLYKEIIEWKNNQIKIINQNLIYKIISIPQDNDSINVEFCFSASEMRPAQTSRIIESMFPNLFGHKFSPSPNAPAYLILTLNLTSGKMNIKSNKFNVYEIAKSYNGGGHTERAGFSLPKKYINDAYYNIKNFDSYKISDYINLDLFFSEIFQKLRLSTI